MKIAITAKLQDGAFKKVLKQAGWTMAELGRRSGISQFTLGRILNLQTKPKAETADTIQRAFGEVGIFFDVTENWPDSFKGFKKTIRIEGEAEMPEERLLELSRPVMAMLDCPVTPDEHLIELEGGRNDTEELLECLSERERKVMELRSQDVSYNEIGKLFLVDRERIRQIEAKALRKIRNYIGGKARGLLPSQIGVPFEYAKFHSDAEKSRLRILQSEAENRKQVAV